MRAIDHFEQNRPVHLAMRDVCYERAVALLRVHAPQAAEIRIADYEEILHLLRTARQHAYFSIRETGKNEKDEQFGHFINLITGNVKSVLSMMNLKQSVDSAEGSFLAFLGANQASIALQAEEYLRRANDIARSIHNTLKLAGEPFEQLKVENSAAATPEEAERYNKAREHFIKQIASGKSGRVPMQGYRKSGLLAGS